MVRMSTQPTAVVGPLREGVIYFGGGLSWTNRIAYPYTPPTDTLDPRYAACTDHRPACDCREAEHAEELKEVRAELKTIREAIDSILAGHLTNTYEQAITPCMCTGCQIARAASILNRNEAIQ